MTGGGAVGGDLAQRGIDVADRRAQRTARGKAAARRGVPQIGRQAGDGRQARGARPVEPRHGLQQAERVRVPRRAEHRIGGALLDDAAGIHHVDAVGVARDDAEIVGDDHQGDPEALAEVFHQLQDLGLDGDVERGGRLVGDDQRGIAGQRDGDHHPLTHAARQFVRVLVEAAGGIGDADQIEQRLCAGAGGRLRQSEMDDERFGDLRRDGEHRVERGHRLLEDHRDVLAAQPPHGVARQPGKVLAAEQDAAADDASGMRRQQPHDAQRGHRFAAAGFADHGDEFARAHIVAHAVDGTDDALAGGKLDAQILDAQQCFRGLRRCGRAGRQRERGRHRRRG